MKALSLMCVPFVILAVHVSTAHGDVSYQYDDLGRLSTVNGNVISFTYDTVGNIKIIAIDSDGDGLTDTDERGIYGTEPQISDTDGDTMPDGWEVANDLNPIVFDTDLDDADSDGFTNREEYVAGTDPQRIPRVVVNSSFTGTGDGKSWATPFATLQDALQSTRLKAEIWMAKGIYWPDHGGGKVLGDPSASFTLKNGVAIYGGFSGASEIELAQRDISQNMTLLCGALPTNSSSYHVVTSTDNDSTAILDGVVITGGNAEPGQEYPDSFGGGMLIMGGSPVISNTVFTINTAECGGGLAVIDASPTLTNVVSTGNTATFGGGMANIGGNLTLATSIISDNTASLSGGGYFGFADQATITASRFDKNRASVGGGVLADTSTAVIDRSEITGNTADYGAGMYCNNGNLTVTNTILIANQATADGGGVFTSYGDQSPFLNDDFLNNSAGGYGGILLGYTQSAPSIVNSILWGNMDQYDAPVTLEYGSSVSITYSDVAGGAGAIVNLDPAGGTVTYDHNITANPLLSEDCHLSGSSCLIDSHLLSGSPCIDTGDPLTVPIQDIDGDSRPKGASLDFHGGKIS